MFFAHTTHFSVCPFASYLSLTVQFSRTVRRRLFHDSLHIISQFAPCCQAFLTSFFALFRDIFKFRQIRHKGIKQESKFVYVAQRVTLRICKATPNEFYLLCLWKNTIDVNRSMVGGLHDLSILACVFFSAELIKRDLYIICNKDMVDQFVTADQAIVRNLIICNT